MKIFIIIAIFLCLGSIALKLAAKNASMKCGKCDTMMEAGEVSMNWTRLVCPKCGNIRFLTHGTS